MRRFRAAEGLRQRGKALGLCLATLVCGFCWTGSACAEGKLELRESLSDGRVFRLTGTMLAKGKVFTRATDGTAAPRPLGVEYAFDYQERRLTGIGREAQAFRTARLYQQAKAQISVGEQLTSAQLREGVRFVIASGEREGVQLFSPQAPFTFSELELLRIPGDSLAALALLPLDPVEVGEVWKPADWVLQLLVGMEAVEKTSLSCKLEGVEGNTARISLAGEIVGADRGAAAGLKVSGTLQYDLGGKFISQLQLSVEDKHSIGIVSPGLDVVAKTEFSRVLVEQPTRLTDAEIKPIPLEPQAGQLMLVFEVPDWGVRFYYDRQWHLFQHLREVAIFRLLEKGQPVTQLNLHRLPALASGVEVTARQFEADVQKAMGKYFQKVLQTEKIPTSDNKTVYRVTVLGQVERPGVATSDKGEKQATIESVPYQWIHYLALAPDGRRITLVFILEPKSGEALHNKDLSMVSGLQFFEPKKPQLQPVGE